LPQVLAEELDADWQRVKVRFVTGKAAYKIAFRQEAPAQKEGASMSTTALYQRLRIAGAAGRDVLVRAAAQRWNIATSACRTENGVVINSRGARLAYGQLAAAAARLPLSAAPVLKDRSRFRLIGKPVARLDTPAKCNGSAVFGIDVVVPGMLNAAIRTARSYSGQVTAIRNEADILKMAGVHAVVKVAALAIANEDAGSQHPRVPHLPRTTRSASLPIISGRPSARSTCSTWSSTAAVWAISRAPGSTPCWRRASMPSAPSPRWSGVSRTRS
jgi:isoquinoline 1-oxidoreductase beta subunit